MARKKQIASPSINAEYIRDHLARVHSYDSFARSLSDQILRSAARKLEKGGNKAAKEVVLSLTATITPTVIEREKKCVQVCLTDPDGEIEICFHVYYEPIKWPWE